MSHERNRGSECIQNDVLGNEELVYVVRIVFAMVNCSGDSPTSQENILRSGKVRIMKSLLKKSKIK